MKPPVAGLRSGVLRMPNPMVALIWLTAFIPGHLFEWWVERAFTASFCVVAAVIMLVKGAQWETRRSARRAAMLLFLIQFCYIASYVYSVAFNGIETGMRDVFELFRYLFVGIFAVYVIRHYDDAAHEAVEKVLDVLPYWALFVLACYIYTVPGLTPFLRDVVYAGTKTVVGGIYGQLRLAAPFENPNFLGFVLTLSLARLIFFSRSPLRFQHAFIALFALFYTGSRSAWAGTAVVLAAAFACYGYLGFVGGRPKLVLQVCLAVAVAMGVGARYADRVLENTRVRRLLTAIDRGGVQEESNAAERLVQARVALDFIGDSPVLGWGPSKYETMLYVDNQYLLWMLRNGLLGFVLIFGGLLWVFYGLFVSARGDVLARVGVLAFGMAGGLMLMTGQFLDNFRVLFLAGFMAVSMSRGRR